MTTPLPRDRAAAALGLDAAADGAAARAAFLRKLADEDFVPPEELVAAVNLLAGATLPLTPDAAATAAADFRAEVDAFAGEFWILTPEVRRARLTALSAGCKEAETAAFLAHLKRGADLAITSFADMGLENLASTVRELFALRPRERAVRRAAWVAERIGESTWPATVTHLRQTDPTTAGLEPALLALLTGVSLAQDSDEVARANLPLGYLYGATGAFTPVYHDAAAPGSQDAVPDSYVTNFDAPPSFQQGAADSFPPDSNSTAHQDALPREPAEGTRGSGERNVAAGTNQDGGGVLGSSSVVGALLIVLTVWGCLGSVIHRESPASSSPPIYRLPKNIPAPVPESDPVGGVHWSDGQLKAIQEGIRAGKPYGRGVTYPPISSRK